MSAGDSGATVALIGSQNAYFRFDSNPSTGYKLIVDESATKNVFEFKTQFERFSDYDPGMVGVGGTNLFTLTGIEAGSGVFRVAYARPWEYDGNWDAFAGTKFSYNINFTPS